MNSVVNDRYSIERKQTLALVHLRHLDAAGIRCDLSPATEYDQIQIRYDAWKRSRSQPATPVRVDRIDHIDRFSPFALPIERLDTGGSDEGGPVVIDDPSSALGKKMAHAWKAQRRGPRRQFAGRRDFGVGAGTRGFGGGSSPDEEDDSPRSRGPGDDSHPRTANTMKRGVDPLSESARGQMVGAPRVPREATEHGRSAFGGGNQGSGEGDMALPPWSSDDNGATKDAQDAMLQRQRDAWKRPRART
jgi:hypothetical protein